jgi:hypothetical protein
LHDLLGVVTVADNPEDDGVEPIGVQPDKLLECLAIASLRGTDEVRLHVGPSGHGPTRRGAHMGAHVAIPHRVPCGQERTRQAGSKGHSSPQLDPDWPPTIRA